MNSNSGFKTISLFSEPYLDNYNKCYKNIITVNLPPQGPLRELVRRVRFNPLSTFKQFSSCNNNIRLCGLALRSISNINGCGCELMVVDEVPDLFSYLLSNGYTIDTNITNMLNKTNIQFDANNGKTLICFITYQG